MHTTQSAGACLGARADEPSQEGLKSYLEAVATVQDSGRERSTRAVQTS
jgi:hypothetical protein